MSLAPASDFTRQEAKFPQACSAPGLPTNGIRKTCVNCNFNNCEWIYIGAYNSLSWSALPFSWVLNFGSNLKTNIDRAMGRCPPHLTRPALLAPSVSRPASRQAHLPGRPARTLCPDALPTTPGDLFSCQRVKRSANVVAVCRLPWF